MEIVKVAGLIEQKIKLLEMGRKELKDRAQRKAETIAEYEKIMAIRILELKNKENIMWQGEMIKNPPNTLIEKIARGMCWQEKLETEKAEAEYRNAIAGLSCIQAELNGYQSINRFLEER